MAWLPALLPAACASGQAAPAPATLPAATRAATTRPATLTFRGCHILDPLTRDQHGRSFAIRGLSGITYDASTNALWAVMDNSDKLVRIDAAIAAEDGALVFARPASGVTLQHKRDFEGISAAGNRGGSVFLSEEDGPGVHEYRLRDGRRVRSLPTPEVFLRGRTEGNRGFESLSLSPDGRTLWTANEHALTVDGSARTPVEPIGATTRVRLLRYALDPATGEANPSAQFVYQTSGVHELAGFNSLSDLVALPDGRLLALERSGGKNLVQRASIRTRIFLVETQRATDVSGPPFDRGLADQQYAPVRKTLLFDSFVCDADGENLEGLCLGPRLGRGRWAVIGVVDDGDGPLRVSRSRVVSFELRLGGD